MTIKRKDLERDNSGSFLLPVIVWTFFFEHKMSQPVIYEDAKQC